MKNAAFIFTILIFFSIAIVSQSRVFDYKISSDFSMKIKGTSNVHDWESTVKKLSGTASVSSDELGKLQINACSVSIPVKSIKSTKGSIMDKKTWNALNSKKHPTIDYTLTDFVLSSVEQDCFTANATGRLTIAGTTKTVILPIKGIQLDNGDLEINGSQELKLTDYNIDPPTALLGALTTGNTVTIEFRIVLMQ